MSFFFFCLGSQRVLDVVDMNTRRGLEMTMKEWQKYYEDPEKDRLLNVVPLEFSHTKLQNYVEAPTLVRAIDWVDCAWPKHLKEAQGMSNNGLDDMMYPQVQKFCFMSVKGCYTDFQICFGGTSLWYHILKGSQVLWLIPPFEVNLQLFEQWVLSGKQPVVFFGDTVEKCGRITLAAGHTLFIPTGWIHATYTRTNSLVFGGNFLHSFGIEKQLKIAQLEEATRVQQKLRYPLFTEMLWYVLERYVHSLLGRSHLDESEDAEYAHPVTLTPVHLTPLELHGLKAIVMYLHSLPTAKKNVPVLIKDPIALIKDVRTVVERHRYDDPDLAVTGVPVLRNFYDGDKDRIRVDNKNGGNRGTGHTLLIGPKQKGMRTGPGKAQVNLMGPRRRRTRCKKCEACMRSDCGECSYCHDMVKFGGLGRAKQTCIMRQCLQVSVKYCLPVESSTLHNVTLSTSIPKPPYFQLPCSSPTAFTSTGDGKAPGRQCVATPAKFTKEGRACVEISLPCLLQADVTERRHSSHSNPGMGRPSTLYKALHGRRCQLTSPVVRLNTSVLGLSTTYQPRHFRARQKSCDIRNIGSDNNSMTDSKDGIKSEMMEGDVEVEDAFDTSAALQTNNIPAKRQKVERQELSPDE
ncbi:hypothetical protein PR048_007623, partial [Dryococelus australis]